MSDDSNDRDRFEELRPQFKRWMWIFGLTLFSIIAAIAVTSGPEPVVPVGRNGRAIIGSLGLIALVGFTYTAGVLVSEWLAEHYADSRRRTRRE